MLGESGGVPAYRGPGRKRNAQRMYFPRRDRPLPCTGSLRKRDPDLMAPSARPYIVGHRGYTDAPGGICIPDRYCRVLIADAARGVEWLFVQRGKSRTLRRTCPSASPRAPHNMKIALIGTGYVGLTTGVTLAFLGHEVTCLDVDEQRIADLQAGRLPFYEPWLDEMFNLVRGQLRFTSEYRCAIPEAEVVFITVGTPGGDEGQPNLSFLLAAAREIGACLERDYTVIV
ncbi:MAG: hypothetical protein EHM13_14335, partial [Acidobacteria bacterium]